MKTRTLVSILILILTVLIIAGSYATAENEHKEKAQRVFVKNREIKIPTGEVNDGNAHFYYTKRDHTKIVFFLLMSDDEVIHAAFDACKTGACGRPRSRYSQDGDYMVCYACGERVHEANINVNKGGCPIPAPLNRAYDADYVTITLTDLDQGKLLFVE